MDETNDDTNDELYYYFLIVYGISLLLCSFFVFISLKNKLYKKTVTEYIQYILIAEIVFSSSKFLSLLRQKSSENTSKVVKYTQMTLDIFSNVTIIVSTFFVSLKIYDSLNHKSKIYLKFNTLFWSRIIILLSSLVAAGTVCCLETIVYPEDVVNKCNIIVCGINDTTGIIINISYLVIMIVVFAFFVLDYRIIKKQYSELEPEEDLLKQKLELMTRKLIYFPLGSCLLWFVFILIQLIVFFVGKTSDVDSQVITVLMLVYSGIRGSVYSLLCLLMNSDFKKRILFCDSTRSHNSTISSRKDNVIFDTSFN